MALIRLYAESLASERPPPGTGGRYTKAILAETDRLLSLANNVLDFSRLEKGVMSLHTVASDLSDICNEALDSFAFRLQNDKISLVRRIEPGVMAMVDKVAMTQVIFNIVDNALKYSESDSDVTVEVARSGESARLCVKDHGPGIADELKQRVFMPFVRGDDSRITSRRGSGIGLSVVAQLLKLMNCSVTLSDNAPTGTIVEIVMPAATNPGSGAKAV